MTKYKKYIIINFYSNQENMVNSPDAQSKTPPKSNIFSINNTMTRSIKRINRKFKKVKNIVLINHINEKQELDQFHQPTYESRSSNSASKSSSFHLICQHGATEDNRMSHENGLIIKKFLIRCKNCLFHERAENNVPKEFVNKIKFIQSDALIDRLFDMKSLLSSDN